jgi:hypothetical protein
MRAAVQFAICSVLGGILASCVLWFHEYAQIVGPLPAYGGEYRIRIQKVTHKPAFNAHALAVSNEPSVVDIRLPHYPAGAESFTAATVSVESDNPEFGKELRAGSVVVDRAKKRVIIDCTTDAGPSPLNGSYPLQRDFNPWGK